MDRLLKVLVVEDSPEVGEFFVEALGKSDAKLSVVKVGNLAEAIEQVVSSRFDAILLDLLLPDAREVEAIEKLQNIVPDVPIVVVSALGISMEEKAMEAGAEDYLSKGVDATPSAIIRAIRHAVVRFEVDRRCAGIRKSLESVGHTLEEARQIEQHKND